MGARKKDIEIQAIDKALSIAELFDDRGIEENSAYSTRIFLGAASNRVIVSLVEPP